MLATVPPVKTPLGQQELRRRTGGLGQRHRTLLFLIDGRRPLSEVLVLGHKAGAATSHLEDLIRLGFVDVPALHPEPVAAPAPLPDRDVPPRVTYVAMEIPAGPMRSQWGTLEAEPHIPVPEVKVLEEFPPAALEPSAEPASENEALPLVEPEQHTEPEPESAALKPQPAAAERSQAEPQIESLPVRVVEPISTPRPAAAVAAEVTPPPLPAPAPVPIPAPAAQARPVPPILQRMALLGRRPAGRPKDPLEEAREHLLKTIKLDRTMVSRRLRPRVVNAKTEGTLIDVVWELERDLSHGQRSHEGLLALQRAREMLQLGNTLVDEVEHAPGMLHG